MRGSQMAAAIFEPFQGNTEQTRFRGRIALLPWVSSRPRHILSRVSFEIESGAVTRLSYPIKSKSPGFSSYSRWDRRENGDNRSIPLFVVWEFFFFLFSFFSTIFCRVSIFDMYILYCSFLLVIIRDSLIHRCNYRSKFRFRNNVRSFIIF